MAIGFLVFISISMYFYPGGNIHDDSQIGYSLTHNFLSDLGAYKAHNGEQNFLSSVFFAFSLGICFFAGLAFFALVGLTPHDLYFDEHVFFALNSFRLLIPATLLYLVLMFKNKEINNYYGYMISFLMASIVAYVMYEIFSGNPMEAESEMIQHATLQKIITLINIVCMIMITFAFESKKNYSALNT
jgi:hypothetical membrane protein